MLTLHFNMIIWNLTGTSVISHSSVQVGWGSNHWHIWTYNLTGTLYAFKIHCMYYRWLWIGLHCVIKSKPLNLFKDILIWKLSKRRAIVSQQKFNYGEKKKTNTTITNKKPDYKKGEIHIQWWTQHMWKCLGNTVYSGSTCSKWGNNNVEHCQGLHKLTDCKRCDLYVTKGETFLDKCDSSNHELFIYLFFNIDHVNFICGTLFGTTEIDTINI